MQFYYFFQNEMDVLCSIFTNVQTKEKQLDALSYHKHTYYYINIFYNYFVIAIFY